MHTKYKILHLQCSKCYIQIKQKDSDDPQSCQIHSTELEKVINVPFSDVGVSPIKKTQSNEQDYSW
jgi:hypothetical protein